MRRPGYLLLLGVMHLISLLPFPALYLLSDFARLIIFGLLKYRRRIIADNIAHAFPEKTAEERARIARRFNRNFCDQWLETIKLLTISGRQLDRRIQGNWDVLNREHAAGRNVYIMLGHTFNWEWGNSATARRSDAVYACMYQPLSSGAFDRLMLRIRRRTGAMMVSMKALRQGLVALQHKTYILGLAADQNPAVTETAQWEPFMHREAPFFRGPEQLARRASSSVVFLAIRKSGRGRYRMEFTLHTADASGLPAGAVVKSYVQFLEETLRAQPDNYLWSHRRWKHTRKPAPATES